MLHESLNETLASAQEAHAQGKLGLEGDLRDIFHRGGFRYLELTLGKKMSFNVNIKSQDDLPNYRAYPPEVRAAMDAGLDAMEKFQQRAIPAKALSSEKMEP